MHMDDTQGLSSKDHKISEMHSRQLVCFAAEKTLMAWIRTSLGLMALGFVIDRFGQFLREAFPKQGDAIFPEKLSIWSGALIVLTGAIMALTATVRYMRFYQRVELEEPSQTRKGISLASVFSLVIAVAGFLLTIFILYTLK